MNQEFLNLGTTANDHTGDTLRSGGFKINRNFKELFYSSPQRHRQSPLIYRQNNGVSDYLRYEVSVGPDQWENNVSITLRSPFVASIAAGIEERGERNLSAVVTLDETPAGWNLAHPGGGPKVSYIRYLWIDRNFDDLTVGYGYSEIAPISSQEEPAAPSTDQHWFDELGNVMKRWTGSEWEVVYRLFVGVFSFEGPGTPDPVNAEGEGLFSYDWSNDETRDMQREAIKYSIIFG